LKQEQLRTAKKKDKKHHQPELSTTSTSRKSEPIDSRKHLQGMRVTQKNLVYVIGLSLKLITDEALALLRGQDYFGQYGKIQKIMINKRKDIPPLRGGTFDKSGSSVSVYVTFQRKEDASKCIAALDGAVVDGNTLRAAYGTTKYCTAFLQHRQCQNPNCMYLHSEQDQDDTESHTREEVVNIQHAVKMGQHQRQRMQQQLRNLHHQRKRNQIGPFYLRQCHGQKQLWVQGRIVLHKKEFNRINNDVHLFFRVSRHNRRL
jgi:CCR4-NOT transcription complex subunit 4